MGVQDTFGRPLRDLRISVTDRCNFRCQYCMPKEIFGRSFKFIPHEQIMRFEEIERLVRIFVDHGVRKVRLTGGEPMVRRDIETLVEMLANVPGVEDLAMTTNGSFPLKRVQSLKDAGLKRMTVSLDALDDATFKQMNDVDFPVQPVLDWIDAAAEAGLNPLKVNMVIKRGVNEDNILPMARYFREKGHILRFIEYMDVGTANGWRLDDVVPAGEIVQRINAEMPIEPADPNYRGEVANRWRYKDGGGEIGVIASVTQAFCGTCTRARLSATGSLYTCLFAVEGHNLRDLMRAGATDAELSEVIGGIWTNRTDRYSQLRSESTIDLPKIEMFYIGG
ncbi:MAG: GTP 3',8-cyclase MoaA [Anaerolineales bacterium]|nr:GTP 3',8-cyclase MoaA [Anaerolineales bacterium]